MIRQRRLFESKSVRKRLTERSLGNDSKQKVDRELGVISDCAILGQNSVNGRHYTDQAMDRAVELYENVIVRVNHDPNGKRSVSEDIGVLRNMKRDGDKVRGDFHFLKSHPLAEYFCERAERFPNTFGFSHEADGLVEESEDGTLRVIDLVYVESVDLVGTPATNMSLFEGVQKMVRKSIRSVIRGVPSKTPGRVRMLEMMDDPATSGDVEVEKEATPEEQLDSALKATMQAILNDPDLSVEEKLAKLAALVGEPVVESGEPEPEKKPVPENEQTPAEPEKEKVPENTEEPTAPADITKMTESIKKELRKEFDGKFKAQEALIKTLTEENDKNAEQIKRAKTETEIRKILEESGVKSPTQEQIDTAVALTGKHRETYIGTLKTLSESYERGGSPRSSGSGGGDPVGSFPKTSEDFKKALRG